MAAGMTASSSGPATLAFKALICSGPVQMSTPAAAAALGAAGSVPAAAACRASARLPSPAGKLIRFQLSSRVFASPAQRLSHRKKTYVMLLRSKEHLNSLVTKSTPQVSSHLAGWWSLRHCMPGAATP